MSLKQPVFGRVAVTAEVSSRDIPRQFVPHGHTAIFIIGSAVMLARRPLSSVIFEAGHIDPASHKGWERSGNRRGYRPYRLPPGPFALAAPKLPRQILAPGRKEHWTSMRDSSFIERRAPAPT